MSYLDLLQLELQARNNSRESFSYYMRFVDPEYDQQWFHKLIADKCQDLYEGKFKKLMIFVPPQHGKSTIVTQNFPAWCLGKNPNLRIAGCSYSASLAETFSRILQRNIECEYYNRVFPDVKIGGAGYVKTSSEFEVNNKKGSYIAASVCGTLTGKRVDIGIIDDPISSALEAYSPTYRNRIWEWYNMVFDKRLHNDSKQILMMTRWHEDDLAGRLLKQEPDEWEVIILPAIKEENNNDYDIRQIGETLWENRHSIDRIVSGKNRSSKAFYALMQQQPTVEGGNIVKRDQFQIISLDRFNQLSKNKAPEFFIDTAFTEKTTNDPSAIISCVIIGYDLYIRNAKKVRLEFPEFIKFLKQWTIENNYQYSSSVRIEPKANGISVVQQLKRDTGLNISEIKSALLSESKETKLNASSNTIDCGHVFLVDGPWVDEFIDEVCGFPAKPHDEYVDLLCYAIDYMQNKSGGIKNLSYYFK